MKSILALMAMTQEERVGFLGTPVTVQERSGWRGWRWEPPGDASVMVFLADGPDGVTYGAFVVKGDRTLEQGLMLAGLAVVEQPHPPLTLEGGAFLWPSWPGVGKVEILIGGGSALVSVDRGGGGGDGGSPIPEEWLAAA